MARPINLNCQFTVKPHKTNGYTYASTQPPVLDPVTKKKKYHYIHWGLVTDNLKFIPGNQYILASPEERTRLIFPPEWDLGETEKFSGIRKPGRPACDIEDVNRFYGDIWLLEQIAKKTGIRQDLEKTFHGNKELVADILTLAIFPYLTNYSYNRVARWQRIEKAPSDRELTPAYITRLTQAITEKNRMDLMKLRAARIGRGAVCAVDSTSRCAYGNSLADIRWGKNKENLPLEQTVEVVVYTLTDHMPIYYRTFPGNIPDSRSLATILTDLAHAGFTDITLITDRGYESIQNLEKYILKGQAMIMCTKTQQKHVMERITELGEFNTRPAGMRVNPASRLYYKQYNIDYEVESTGKSTKKADRLKLNLYFDSVRRSEELLQLDIDIENQKKALVDILTEKVVLDDAAVLKRCYRYFKLDYDPSVRILNSFELNEKKVAKARKLSGFFAITTHKLDLTATETLDTYRLRDEQEKYFQQMKDRLGADRQNNWSEEGKTGRLLILYVGLILGSYVRHIWKTTELHDHFSSSLEILDDMRSIRCIEHTNKAKFITPFVGPQVLISQVFGFEIPEGCSPAYLSRQSSNRKRGRPRKKIVE